MTEQELLFVIGMEECDEISQRLSKALRFGLDQIQEDPGDKPEQNPERLDNRERIRREFVDLVAVLRMISPDLTVAFAEEIKAKQEKIRTYFARSRAAGHETPAPPGSFQPSTLEKVHGILHEFTGRPCRTDGGWCDARDHAKAIMEAAGPRPVQRVRPDFSVDPEDL